MCMRKEGSDVPGYAEVESVLYGGEVGEYAEDYGGSDYHNDEPEVQLGFGPVVFPPALDGDYLCSRHLGGRWRCGTGGR